MCLATRPRAPPVQFHRLTRMAREVLGKPTMNVIHQGSSGAADRELEEVLDALLLQERLVRFARQLVGADRVILEERLLAPRPASIQTLSHRLGVRYHEAKKRVRQLEARLRDALRSPAAGHCAA
jgi:DNA-directed RNA polymerase sigma subunit (sigma70/sigma32)